MRIEIEAFGDKQVSRELLRFGDRAGDASPAFHSIAELLESSEEKQFRTQGRHASAGWKKLEDATVKAKRRSSDPRVRANAAKILQATGALKDSLTADVQGVEGGSVRIIDPHQLIFGTQIGYAKFHQRGGGVPRRRVLELRARDRVEIVKRMQRFLVTGRPR